jgi:hypothetical protein
MLILPGPVESMDSVCKRLDKEEEAHNGLEDRSSSSKPTSMSNLILVAFLAESKQ